MDANGSHMRWERKAGIKDHFSSVAGQLGTATAEIRNNRRAGLEKKSRTGFWTCQI